MFRMTQLENVSLMALTVAIVSATLWIGGGVSAPASAVQQVDFARDVWPIVEARCVSCHGPVDQFNDLRMDTKEALLAGGRNGKIIVAGQPDQSTFYTRIVLPADDLDLMPAEGDPLTADEIAKIRDWIAQGADFGSWTGE